MTLNYEKPPFVGIHVYLYLPRQDFETVLVDVKKRLLVAVTDLEEVTPLERFNILILQQAGVLFKEEHSS